MYSINDGLKKNVSSITLKSRLKEDEENRDEEGEWGKIPCIFLPRKVFKIFFHVVNTGKQMAFFVVNSTHSCFPPIVLASRKYFYCFFITFPLQSSTLRSVMDSNTLSSDTRNVIFNRNESRSHYLFSCYFFPICRIYPVMESEKKKSLFMPIRRKGNLIFLKKGKRIHF